MLKLAVLLALCAPASAAPPNPKSFSSFSFDASRPAAERIADMPRWLVKWWSEADGAPHYRSYRPTAAERRVWSQAVEGLPARMRAVLDERLIAAYFVSGLKGNGITDWALDSSSRVYVYMVFNPASFQQTLSQTLTQRERSVFRGKAAVSIDAGKGGSGMLYSVAHESAHAFDYVEGLTPYTDGGVAEALSRPTGVSWDVWDSYWQPRPENDFPLRSSLHFYGFSSPSLKASQAAQVYAQLSSSPFASLYGSVNWADDAADLFVFYHLTVALGRPYRIQLRGPGGIRTAAEPMSNPRVRDRAAKILAPIY